MLGSLNVQKRDIVRDPSLVLDLPLHLLDGSKFMSKDAYGHLCTVTGALWRLNGRKFNGSSDHISVPHHDQLSPPVITINQQVRINAADVGQNSTSLGKGDFSVSAGEYALQKKDVEVIYFFHTGGGAGDFVRTTDKISANRGYHISATITSIGAVLIGINGEKSISGTMNALPRGTAVLYIGGRDDGTVTNWDGDLGDLLLYSRVLNSLENQRNRLATKWRWQ